MIFKWILLGRCLRDERNEGIEKMGIRGILLMGNARSNIQVATYKDRAPVPAIEPSAPITRNSDYLPVREQTASPSSCASSPPFLWCSWPVSLRCRQPPAMKAPSLSTSPFLTTWPWSKLRQSVVTRRSSLAVTRRPMLETQLMSVRASWPERSAILSELALGQKDLVSSPNAPTSTFKVSLNPTIIFDASIEKWLTMYSSCCFGRRRHPRSSKEEMPTKYRLLSKLTS